MPVLALAIAKWSPAMEVSSFRIQPDYACKGNYYCLCHEPQPDGQMVNTDALRIWNGMGPSRDWKTRDVGMLTRVGYKYNAPAWRQRMQFGGYHALDDDTLTFWSAVISMAHELGHAAGLLHEHQRPDAGQFVNINFQNIRDYDDVAKKLFPDDPNRDQRMEEIFNDWQLAEDKWESALSFMPLDVGIWSNIGGMEASQPFDFESIMIYNSRTHAKRGTKVIERTPAWAKDDGDTTVWIGGHPNPERAGISGGDIARIAELYPLGAGAGPASPHNPRDVPDNTNGTRPGAPIFSPRRPVSVVIPGLLTTIVRPVPTYEASDVKSALASTRGCIGCESSFQSSPDFIMVSPKTQTASAGADEPDQTSSASLHKPSKEPPSSDYSPGTAITAPFPPIPNAAPGRNLITTSKAGNDDGFIASTKGGDSQ